MKTLALGFLGVSLFGSVAAIVAANLRQDSTFFQFQWRLIQEAQLEVKLATAKRGPVVRTVEAPGKIEADQEVKISAQVVGRIVELPIQEGDTVRKGDLLVQLDRIQYQADVQSGEAHIRRLKASLEAAEADLVKSKRDVERNQQLYATQSISRSEMLDSDTAYHKDLSHLVMSRADLADAESALTRVKEDLARTTIRAPRAGVVSQLLAKEGEVVVVGTMNNPGTVILSISEPQSMVVRARIDENNVRLVRQGQKARVFLQNDDQLVLQGTVKRISPKGINKSAASAASATANSGAENEVAIFETIIQLETPPPQVRLGMSANVEIQVDERVDALSVPTQAVLHRRAKELPPSLIALLGETGQRRPGVKDPSRRYHQVAFVAVNGKAECRLVRTGISDEMAVEILEGLREGEQVIAGPYRVFDKLKDGRPVTEMNEKDDADE